MGQTLKWWPAQSIDWRPRWREQKNIYNQRDITKRRTAIRKTPGSSIGGVSEEKKKNSSSNKARGRTLTLSSTTPLTILFPKDPVRPLTVGFGFAHIYSESTPLPQNRDPTIGAVCGKNLCASENDNRTRQGQTPRGNDDGQPTRPQMENCREVPSSAGVWRHVRGPRPH